MGSFYKDPFYPIWLLNNGNHFSVLFGVDSKIIKNDSEDFSLFVYDIVDEKNKLFKFILSN